jgi:hypothetical protein
MFHHTVELTVLVRPPSFQAALLALKSRNDQCYRCDKTTFGSANSLMTATTGDQFRHDRPPNGRFN